MFASAGCGGCHTLADAGTNGNVGPNLDDAKPDASLVTQRDVTGQGVMPSFKDQLSEKQIADVAAYVVRCPVPEVRLRTTSRTTSRRSPVTSTAR